MDIGWLHNFLDPALIAVPLLGLIGSGARGVKVGGKTVGGKMSGSQKAKFDNLRSGSSGAGVDPKDKARAQQQMRDLATSANQARLKAKAEKPKAEPKPAAKPKAEPKPAAKPKAPTAAERRAVQAQLSQVNRGAPAAPKTTTATTPTATGSRRKRASQSPSTRRDAQGLSSRDQKRLEAARKQLKDTPKGGSSDNQRRREILRKTVNQLQRKQKSPIGTKFPYNIGG